MSELVWNKVFNMGDIEMGGPVWNKVLCTGNGGDVE